MATTVGGELFGRPRQIVIRLVRPTAIGVQDLRRTRGRLARFIVEHKLQNRRLITSVPPRRVLELERVARRNGFGPPQSLTAYWLLDAGATREALARLLTGLRELPEVAVAYRMPRVKLAAGPPNDAIFTGGPPAKGQPYFRAAPVGIDAEWAWALATPRNGAGVWFVDLEFYWHSPHEDVAVAPRIAGGGQQPNPVPPGTPAFHGLANLGLVVARTNNNSVGMAGAAPAAAVMCASADYGPAIGVNYVDAITAVSAWKPAGATVVLLIELQTATGRPIEHNDPGVRGAILTAVGNNIVVVEAAGNNNVDIDAGTAVDSGAILVGAGSSVPGMPAQQRSRAGGSNFGTRVNCFAWGENVETAGGIGTTLFAPDPGQAAPNRYTKDYSGTSSAAAIVAGAAVLVQSVYKASSLGPLSPPTLRTLLKATGTNDAANQKIGTMPDLRKILHDVYIRDALGDTGAVPSTGLISMSPDIIVTTSSVADPQATYGAGSPNENVDTLGAQVEAGQANYVYVRMKNRGTGTANATTATVWWSHVATLVTPGVWTLIGTTPPVDVKPTLTVTGALTWSTVPATGHYCFVAVAHHPLDPAPPPPTGSWTDFENFIRNNNNATWRNFNVVDLLPNVPQPVPFRITGAPDRERDFELEVLQRRGGAAKIVLEMPLELARLLPAEARRSMDIDEEAMLARIDIPRDGPLELGHVTLPADAEYGCRFVIRPVRRTGAVVPTVAMRQRFREFEVGRVTWGYRIRALA